MKTSKSKQNNIKLNENPVTNNTKPLATPGQYVQRTVKNIRNIDNFTPSLNPIKYESMSNYDVYSRDYVVDVSREMYSNSSIYRAVINTIVDLVVGADGFLLNCKTKNNELNLSIKNYFYNYFQNGPEVSKRYIGREFEREIIKEYLVAGEVFLYKTKNGLQLIYSEEIDKIQYDKYRKLENIKLKASKGQPQTEIKESDLIYKINYEATSIRGYPMLTSAITLLLRLHGIMESEAFSWSLVSRIPMAVKRNADPQFLNQPQGQQVQAANREVLMDYGLFFECSPDEELQPIPRTIPQVNLSNAVMTFLRVATSITGIPAELFLNSIENLNYSQSRLLIDRAKGKIKDIQIGFVYNIYDKITQYLILKMKSDKLLADDYFQNYAARNTIQWVPAVPFATYMEKSELDNQTTMLQFGFTTASEMIAERYGKDRKDILDQRVNEIEDAIIRVQAINEKYGTNLDPSILLGAQMSINNNNKETVINENS